MSNFNKKAVITAMSIGVTASAVGAIALALSTPKKIKSHKLKAKRNEVKKFIAEHTGKNKKLVSIVDKLSDNQIDNIEEMINKIKQKNSKIYLNGNNIKELTRKIINQVANELPSN